MVFYDEGYYRGLDFAWEYIDRNQATYGLYLNEKFTEYDKSYGDFLCRRRPKDVYYALKDFQDDPITKFEKTIELYKQDGHVQLVFGSRRSGKTATVMYICEQLYEQGIFNSHEFGWVGLPNPNIPDWFTYYPSIQDAPEDMLLIQDEAGIQASGRNFASKENQDLGKLLMVAGHQNKTIIFITQYTASVDIEIVRQSSSSLIKPNAIFQASTERENLFKSLVDFMMPKRKDESMIVSGNDIMTIKTKLPSFWNDSVSKFYRKLKDEDEAIAVAYNFFKAGANFSLINSYLSKSSFEFDEKTLRERFKKFDIV